MSKKSLWTQKEDVLLVHLVNEGYNTKAIANMMERSTSTICTHRRLLGIAASRPGKQWTAEEDALLEKLNLTNLTLPDIAKQIGRTSSSVIWRRKKLGLSLRTKASHRYHIKQSKQQKEKHNYIDSLDKKDKLLHDFMFGKLP